MVFIYVLKLEFNKYYVGKTTSPINRVNGHFDIKGSAWTKKYKPVDIIEIIPNCDDLDEDKYTLKYMKEKGIQNVRGGTFCNINLVKTDVITIRKMIDFSSDKCYICGKTGHFASNCKEEYDKVLDEIFTNMIEKDLLEKIDTKQQDLIQKKSQIDKEVEIKCLRCGRFGHIIEKCYSKTTIDGKLIEDSKHNKPVKQNKSNISNPDVKYPCEKCKKEFDTLNGKNYHLRFYCNKKTKKSEESNNLNNINQNQQNDNKKLDNTETESKKELLEFSHNINENTNIVDITQENISNTKSVNNPNIILVDTESVSKIEIESKSCDCIGSYLSPHLVSKCKMKKVFSFF
jgi:predicted GIY-YIG superfamily endonuclease